MANAQSSLLASCKDQLQIIKARFERELDPNTRVQSDYPEAVTRNESSLRSAVGIVLNGTAIDFFLPGVPAARMLRKGDVILEIDGQPVDSANASTLLIGNDKPGSNVTLKCKCAPSDGVGWGSSFVAEEKTKTVTITRIPSEAVADRRCMLEYLRQLKVAALQRQDPDASAVADKTMDLWQRMMLADNDHRTRMLTDYSKVSAAAFTIIDELSNTLAKLEQSKNDLAPCVLDMERLGQADIINMTLRKQLNDALADGSNKDIIISDLSLKLKKLENELAPCIPQINAQKQRLKEQAEATERLNLSINEMRQEERRIRLQANALESEQVEVWLGFICI